jgi:hypothetical protein
LADLLRNPAGGKRNLEAALKPLYQKEVAA